MVKVKVCGITNLKDALSAIECGCAALGFVFYKKSLRYIRPEKASSIIKRLPKGIIKVGVFVDSSKKEVGSIARKCTLDMLQFHGDEDAVFCSQFPDYRVIKAFRIKKRIAPQGLAKYKTFAYLFDTYSSKKPGGTGKSFDWKMLKGLRKIKKPVFLAGGLTEKNVREAVKIVAPEWVDVSTSVEIRPGRKDHNKIKKFINTVKEPAL